MPWTKKLKLRIRSLFLRRKVEDEMDYEIRFHLENQIEENIAAGMEPKVAIMAAHRKLGMVESLKEEVRDRRRVRHLENLIQDVRYGLRQLRRNPGFTVVSLATLALGIGANTAIFSITNEVLLRQLPVQRPGELVILRSPGYKTGRVTSDGDSATSFSYPLYKELRDNAGDVAAVIARYAVSMNVSGQGQTENVDGELVSGNYFQVLGVPPAIGRVLGSQDETAPGADTVAVLSYAYWQRRFGSDESILNKPLTINGASITIVGVTRAGFSGVQVGALPDIFVPLTMKAQMTPNWDGLDEVNSHWLALLARLKPGFTPARAEAAILPTYRAILESEAPLTKMAAAQAQRFIDRPLLLDPGARGRQILQRDLKQPLTILMIMVASVLLIACANLAGLLLARGTSRQREIALRLALGAGRRRLIRQLLTESLLLSLIGGGLGLLLGLWALKALLASVPADYGALGLRSGPNVTLFLFALGVSVATGLLFGLAPALRSTRSSVQSALKEQGASVSQGISNIRLRKVLIVSQIMITTLLLVGAGLFARSFDSLKRVDLGIRTQNVISFSVSPQLNRYSPAQTAAFADRTREEIKRLPGVRSVSAASIPVLAGSTSQSNVTVEGYTPPDNEEDLDVATNFVGPDFFATMGIPLIAGRELRESDTEGSPKVAIVNEAFAKRFLGDRTPIGVRFCFGAGKKVHPDIEIVGMVKDSKNASVRGEIPTFAYLPYSQDKVLGELTFYIRTDQDPIRTAGTLRQTVAQADPNLPVNNLKTLTKQIDEGLFDNRLLTVLSLSFALLASVLAAIGLYGVMAYTVAQRTREVGIRMALGAARGAVLWLVLREVAQMAVAGLVLGSASAFALGRFIEGQLFGVKAKDPVAFAIAIALLAVVAFFAGYGPARRASSLDPMKALRYE
jgi:putative ABC transport system permease protein